MNDNGAFGDVVAEHFRLGRAHSSQRISICPSASFAVTRLTWGEKGFGRSQLLAPEKALIIVLQLEPLLKHQLWLGRKPQSVEPWAAGTMSIVDLEQEPSASVASASDVLHFYLPRSSLQMAADHDEVHPIQDLNIDGGTDDGTVYRLGRLMLPVLQNPDEANLLFLTGLMTALHAHLRQTYGTPFNDRRVNAQRLSSAQLYRAKEMICADLTGNMTLGTLAAGCQLPSNKFALAFRQSTGVAPHRWLLLQRVEHAKKLLKLDRFNEDEIAKQCGFANRKHLVRVFFATVGSSPSQWRLNNAPSGRADRSV